VNNAPEAINTNRRALADTTGSSVVGEGSAASDIGGILDVAPFRWGSGRSSFERFVVELLT
jgi:hypothetical protein